VSFPDSATARQTALYGPRVKRSLGLVAALVASAALALGPVGTAQAAPAKVLTKPQLKVALLTVKDLPKGFKIDRSSAKDSSGDMEASSRAAGCARLVQAMNASPDPDAGVPQATVDFTRHHGMEAIENTVMSFRSAAAVRKDFASFVSPAKTCHRVVLTDPSDGTKIAFTLTHRKLRVNGYRTLLVTMHGRYDGVRMDFAIAGSQMRNNEVTVMTTGIEQSTTAETRQAKSLLSTATKKLAKHLH